MFADVCVWLYLVAYAYVWLRDVVYVCVCWSVFAYVCEFMCMIACDIA